MTKGEMTTITEATVKYAALIWLTAHGPDIAHGTLNTTCAGYGQVALARRQWDAGQEDSGVSPVPRKIETHILPEVP